MSETINPENNAPADSIEAKISRLCKPWDSKKIKSLQDFLEWVDTQEKILKILNEKFLFYDDSFELFYRGVSSHTYEDIPSVLREESYKENETEFIRKCQTERFQEFSDDQTRFDTLVKMQHYGFPTRLLDITRNPLVALYFSSQQSHTEKKEDDGKVEAIFISKTKIVTVGSEACAIYSYFPFINNNTKKYLREIYYSWCKKDTSESSYSRRQSELIIQNSQKDISDFDQPMRKMENGIISFGELMNVFCVIPRMNNERIKKQVGAFLIYGLGKSSICKLRDISEYLKIFDLFSVRNSLSEQDDYLCYLTKSCDLWEKMEYVFNVHHSVCMLYREEIRKYKNDCEYSKKIKDSIIQFPLDGLYYQKKELFRKEIRNQINEFEKQIYCVKYSFPDIKRYLPCEKDINDYLIKQNIIEILSAAFGDYGRGIPRLIMKEEVKVKNDQKKAILDELSKIGISEETLFPELEHYAESLKRKARERKMNRGKKKKRWRRLFFHHHFFKDGGASAAMGAVGGAVDRSAAVIAHPIVGEALIVDDVRGE